MQQGLHKILQGKSAKTADTLTEDWEEIDLKAASTIQPCLADDVMYNVMDEETATRLWSRLNIVYDKKPLQQAVSQETTIWTTHEGRDINVGASKLL